MQNAEIVEMIVKYHSNQNKTDPYIAENASKNTNQSHEKVADLVEDQVEMIEVLDLVIEMTDHEKCLTQNAEIVEMIVKYHLDQRKIDLYIAENASKNTDNINKFFEKNTQNFVTFIRINNYKLTQSLMIK
jgi:UDP-N-acetyl-D-mannosaminuronate dehydrogenase